MAKHTVTRMAGTDAEFARTFDVQHADVAEIREDGELLGHIEVFIKPGTRDTRQYAFTPLGGRRGLLHKTRKAAIEDAEQATRPAPAPVETEVEVEVEVEVAEVEVPTAEQQRRRDGDLVVTDGAFATTDEPEELIDAAVLASERRTHRALDVFRFNGRPYLIVDAPGPHYGQRVIACRTDGPVIPVPTIDLRSVRVSATAPDGAPQLGRDVDTGEIVLVNVEQYARTRTA